MSAQFKWREPENTGGRDIFQYYLQMKPPPVDQQETSLDEVGVSFCLTFGIVVLSKTLQVPDCCAGLC